MRAAHVSCPQVELGGARVTHDDYMGQVLSRFPEGLREGADARKVRLMTRNLGVDTQYLSRPLDSTAVAGGGLAGEREEATLEDVLAMGVPAVERTLADTGVDRREVHAVVVSTVSRWGAPGIANHLVEACDLNRDVDKTEMNSVACAGGAAALAKAFDYISAYPDRRVLVVVPERLSTIIHGDDTDLMDITHGRSFSDSAAACIVSGYQEADRDRRRRLGPGMIITHRHEYQMPGTLGHYFGKEDHRGKHFRSNKEGVEVTRDIIPEVLSWMKHEGIPAPEWTALHPGSERIIRIMAKAWGIDPDVKGMARRSYESLREGNKGAVAALDVLARTHDDPPAHLSPGILAAVGPGVNFVTCAGYFSRG